MKFRHWSFLVPAFTYNRTVLTASAEALCQRSLCVKGFLVASSSFNAEVLILKESCE